MLSLQPETMGIRSRNGSVLLFCFWVFKGCLSEAVELHRGSQDSSALRNTSVVVDF